MNPMNFIRRVCCALLCVSLINAAMLQSNARANPTSAEPEKALNAVGAINGAEKQITLMYEQYSQWEKLGVKSAESMKAGKRFSHQQLSAAFSKLFQSVWNAKHLQAMGEPAGHDLERKFMMLANSYRMFVPALGSFQQKELMKLKKESAKRIETIAKANRLAEQGKLAEAERMIQNWHLKQLTSIFYLSNSQASPFENDVNATHLQILDQLNRQRRETYREQTLSKLQTYKAAAETLRTESQRITAELRQSSTVQLSEGESGDAADAIRYITGLWGKASASCTRCVGLAWAVEQGGTETVAEPYKQATAQIDAIGTEAIGAIINAASASTPADQIPALLPKVLDEVSVVQRRHSGELKGVSEQIDVLVAKNPTLSDQAKRYDAATLEPMRWMKRFTKQQVKSLETNYPDAASLLGRKLKPADVQRPSLYQRTTNRDRVLTPSTIGQPASWTVAESGSLVGMTANVPNTLRLSPKSKSAIAPHSGLYYASLQADFPIQNYAADMAQSLLLDDSHGPLSLAAAEAQSSALRQEFANVGGQITRLTLEPAISRWATLPDAVHSLVPLGDIPTLPSSGSAHQKALWRLELKPEWVAHHLFLARPKQGS